MEKSAAGSRLLQMKARFQQKQMAEREMKIASLYEAQQTRALTRVRHAPATPANPPAQTVAAVSPPPAASVQHGKVRQMFEERRTKAGIDKSYPLQPIHNNNNNTAPRRANGQAKIVSTSTTNSTKLSVSEKRSVRTNVSSHSVRKQKIDNLVNGSGDLNHNHESDLNTIKERVSSRTAEADEVDSYRLEDETFPEGLAPAPTPRSPSVSPAPRPPPRRSPVAKNGVTSRAPHLPPPPAKEPTPPPRRGASETTVPVTNKGREAMLRTSNSVQKKPSTGGVTNTLSKPRSTSAARSATDATTVAGSGAGGAPCSVCGRRFAPDRLQKHEEICRRSHNQKKRKPFDAIKHRLTGTEAEPFISKIKRGAATPSATSAKQLNSNWRQKHEEFISAIRAAKQVQAHLNAGGKLSDLPPPPPSENPDYVQCPHCSRRFNQAAAERHIPKCASYQFNKPKPQASRRR